MRLVVVSTVLAVAALAASVKAAPALAAVAVPGIPMNTGSLAGFGTGDGRTLNTAAFERALAAPPGFEPPPTTSSPRQLCDEPARGHGTAPHPPQPDPRHPRRFAKPHRAPLRTVSVPSAPGVPWRLQAKTESQPHFLPRLACRHPNPQRPGLRAPRPQGFLKTFSSRGKSLRHLIPLRFPFDCNGFKNQRIFRLLQSHACESSVRRTAKF
jgi:hypothetical protein